MPTECDNCGKESYIIYVKPNPGNICDECEDEERRTMGRPNGLDIIKKIMNSQIITQTTAGGSG